MALTSMSYAREFVAKSPNRLVTFGRILTVQGRALHVN